MFLALWWCLVVAAAPWTSVAAQPTAKERAAAAYREGSAAFKAGRFAKALESFEKAYKLDPSPILLYNLARAYEEMGNAEKAIENFELYLARVPDAPDRAEVETRIRVTRKMMERGAPSAAAARPRLTIDSHPPGAVIWIDDLHAGRTPLEVEATVGRHTVRAALEGHAAATREVDVEAGARVGVTLQLVPIAAAEDEHDGWQRPAAYGAFAASALGLALAGVFYVHASDAADEADTLRGEPASHRALQNDFDAARLGMWLSVGGAALLAGTGATLLLVEPDGPQAASARALPVLAW